MSSRRRLYRGQRGVPADFRERYGSRAPEVYGKTVGKVKREQAAENGGRIREYVGPHEAANPGGEGEHRVRGHYEEIRADGGARTHSHPHSRGDHPGRCSKACQRGQVAHRHRGRRRGSRAPRRR